MIFDICHHLDILGSNCLFFSLKFLYFFILLLHFQVNLFLLGFEVLVLLLDEFLCGVMGLVDFCIMLLDVGLLLLELRAFLVDDISHMIELLRSHRTLTFMPAMGNFRIGTKWNGRWCFCHSCIWLDDYFRYCAEIRHPNKRLHAARLTTVNQLRHHRFKIRFAWFPLLLLLFNFIYKLSSFIDVLVCGGFKLLDLSQ